MTEGVAGVEPVAGGLGVEVEAGGLGNVLLGGGVVFDFSRDDLKSKALSRAVVLLGGGVDVEEGGRGVDVEAGGLGNVLLGGGAGGLETVGFDAVFGAGGFGL